MKKYLSSEPLSVEKKRRKKQVSCVVTGNLSPTMSSTPQFTSKPPDLQSLSTESSTKSQEILLSQLIEAQPSISQDESYAQRAPTGKDNSVEPDVIDNNIVTEQVIISIHNIAGNNDNEVVCIFCNKKKKKVRSRMLPLHSADIHKLKASINSKIEGHEEYKNF
ncbi:hypothetical protein HHI36_010008 [Cryptolaemus montrouzieri]|uniref:Uncharacterized protein n=1 Tax=Cryptolaemus montrouzieri TaxID=559131 RepID=A0ABD2MHL1_9CUCU